MGDVRGEGQGGVAGAGAHIQQLFVFGRTGIFEHDLQVFSFGKEPFVL